MVAHPLPPTLTVEEYLELELNSTVKHEYLDGYVYAMAGGTVEHGLIAVNVLSALRPQLRGGPCRVYNSDVKVRLAAGRFVYPDVSVSCDPRDHAAGQSQYISHPRVVVEVLSPRAADYDQGDKFAMYATLASLESYVLVATDRRAVEVRTRAAGAWQTAHHGPQGMLVLLDLNVTCPIAAFYEDTDR